MYKEMHGVFEVIEDAIDAAYEAQRILEANYTTEDRQKLAEFSPDRTCLRTQGLRLIEINDICQLLNVSVDSLTEKLGQPHADIGSGFSVPAYITDDAELLCFELENDSVVEIILRDLFTGEIVDRVAG